ncbi:putative zinc finger protein 861 isoform X1 [Symphalangus syndactylus]|uniref:putative zinc finger protein 861 isoform X1 n=1 Tax=Symphalangus syndactylus TaxID=9590 RepID=UPI003003FFD8
MSPIPRAVCLTILFYTCGCFRTPAFEDVAVNLTLEEWALLGPSQTKLYRDVMRETIRMLASVVKGKKWEDENIEDLYQNPGRNLRNHMVERPCENKEGSQCGEVFSQIPGHNLNKKTPPGVKPPENHVCGEVSVGCSSTERHIRDPLGCKPCEYPECRQKAYTCKPCGNAFHFHHSFQTHERPLSGENFYEC